MFINIDSADRTRAIVLQLLIVLTVILLHFTPITIGGYPLTLGFIGAVTLMAFGVRIQVGFPSVVFFVLCIFLLCLMHVPRWLNGELNFIDYWKSQAIIFTAVCYLFFSVNGRLLLERSSFIRALKLSLLTLSVFLLLQFATFYILGWQGLFGIFGDYSYGGVIHGAVTQGSIRCYGFYLEPSYCAMVVFFLGACLAVLRQLNYVWMAVILVDILFIKSVFGFSVYFVLLVYFAYIKGMIAIRLTLRHLAYLAAGLSTISVLFIFGVFDPMLSRFSELYTPGTSGYFRFIAPGPLMVDTLLNQPFGYGPGSVEAIMSLQNISMGPNKTQLSLDNGIYVLILYYGIFGLLSVMYILFSSVKYFLLREDQKSFLFLMIFMSLNFTGGGIFNLEYIFLVALLFWSTSVANRDEKRGGLQYENTTA